MPIPSFPPPPPDESPAAGRLACQNYVAWVQGLLQALLHDEEYSEQFDQNLRALAQQAWGDVVPRFADVIGQLGDGPNEPIVQHGLYGRQLCLKMTVVHRRLTQWFAGVAHLRHLLKVVDDLLDSILAAIGAGGAIKEFKKAVEESTTD